MQAVKSPGRRKFLGYMAAGLSTPFLLSACKNAEESSSPTLSDLFDMVDLDAFANLIPDVDNQVFDLSVASGDPTPSGVMLWTHISLLAYGPATNLAFQVANDQSFSLESVVLAGMVNSEDIKLSNDRTIHIDLDGLLESNRYYYYRFVYNNTVSNIGRCRTTPENSASVSSLKMAVLTCQDYTNGYYGALNYVAEDDSIDYVVHLGDFIYESVGDPSFQSLPFEDRLLTLPGGLIVAKGLEDYRTLYRAIRSDPFMQRAMENHTWIVTTDDHETANDCYWDYELDTLGAPDHPFTTDPMYGNDLSLLTNLKLDSQRAWAEYIPARVSFDFNAQHPHQALTIYRDFTFGNLVQIFMTDTRTYRTPHPCGIEERYAAINCDAASLESQSMYGENQRDWLAERVLSSSSQWKVLGNQTFMGAMDIDIGDTELLFNVDAWDGYKAERNWLMNLLINNNVENFVVLTGDFHSAIAAQLLDEYRFRLNPAYSEATSPAVEFMTPAITSSNLKELLSSTLNTSVELATALSNKVVKKSNQHIRYFSGSYHGYSTIEFTPDYCEWTAYSVDKNVNSETAARKIEATFKKYPGDAMLEEVLNPS